MTSNSILGKLTGHAGTARGAKVPKHFVHESSFVDGDVSIGQGTKIWHFCHVMAGAQLGEGCSIGQNVMIGPRVSIGSNVKIQNNVSVYEGVTLEDDVFCGPSMVFTNVINPRSHVSRKSEFRETRVRQGSSIGANATIVCGCTIGRFALIGAGAVVTKDVPDFALVVGVPATVIGWVCQCGERLRTDCGDDDLLSCACGCSYQQTPEGSILEVPS